MSRVLHRSFSAFGSIGVVVLTLVIAACGGGGGSDSGGSSELEPVTPSTGTFIDSPVSNIGYRTESIPNGVTDENGHFDYLPGETLTFFIGDLEFPSYLPQETITPLELAEPAYLAEGDSNTDGLDGVADSYARYTTELSANEALGWTRLVSPNVRGAVNPPLIGRIEASMSANPNATNVVFTFGPNELGVLIDADELNLSADETFRTMRQDFLIIIGLIRRGGKHPIAGKIHAMGQAYAFWSFDAGETAAAQSAVIQMNNWLDANASSTTFSLWDATVVNANADEILDGNNGTGGDTGVDLYGFGPHWNTAATDPAQDGRVTAEVNAALSASAGISQPTTADNDAAAAVARMANLSAEDSRALYGFVYSQSFLGNWDNCYEFYAHATNTTDCLTGLKAKTGNVMDGSSAATTYTYVESEGLELAGVRYGETYDDIASHGDGATNETAYSDQTMGFNAQKFTGFIGNPRID